MLFDKIIKITFLLFLLVSSPVTAQNRNDAEQWLQRLDSKIENVVELARSYDVGNRNNQQISEGIERARRMRDQVEGHMRQMKWRMALEKAKSAMAGLEQTEKLIVASAVPGTLLRIRNELEELLQNAESSLTDCSSRDVLRVLDTAKKYKNEGERAESSRHVEKAIDRYHVGIELLRNMKSRVGDMGRLDNEKRKFQQILERAREAVATNSNDRLSEIYRNAVQLAEKSHEAEQNGNCDLAQKFLNQSSLLLLRALDIARPKSPQKSDQIESFYHRLQERMETIRKVVMQSDNRGAKELFKRAQGFMAEVEQAAEEKKNDKAEWKLKMAENMLNRSHALAGGQPVQRQFDGRIAEEIENVKDDINAISSKFGGDISEDAKVLIRMAKLTAQNAEKALSKGLHRVALEAVLAAQSFLTRAERVLEKTDRQGVSSKQILSKLEQLDAAISEAEQRITESAAQLSLQLLQSAMEIREFADDSFKKGNYIAANEAIQVSFDLLRKSLKNYPRRP